METQRNPKEYIISNDKACFTLESCLKHKDRPLTFKSYTFDNHMRVIVLYIITHIHTHTHTLDVI